MSLASESPTSPSYLSQQNRCKKCLDASPYSYLHSLNLARNCTLSNPKISLTLDSNLAQVVLVKVP